MKKFKLLVASMALAFGLSACQTNQNPGGGSTASKQVVSVVLNEDARVGEVGEEFKLTPTITYKDDQEVQVSKLWKSSNSKVATVDQEGNVKIVGTGLVNIVFIAGNRMAVCKITVKSADEPEPTPTPVDPTDPDAPKVTLSVGSKTLYVGESFELTAETNIEGGLAWTCPDNLTLEMNSQGNGAKVTALAVGQAYIIASAGTQEAKCLVKVLDKDQPTPEPGPDPEEEDEDKSCTVYFFVDFNNADDTDTTKTKLLSKFKWYTDRPLKDSTDVPTNPTTALDPAFPYFIGWSSHPIIDETKDLWNIDTDVTGNRSFIYIYGIWSDVRI